MKGVILETRLVPKSAIANSLDVTKAGLVLDARQGKALKELIQQSTAKENSLSGTTNADGYLVTTINANTRVISARCTSPAAGCLALFYEGVWYFLPVVPNNGQLVPMQNRQVTVLYWYA